MINARIIRGFSLIELMIAVAVLGLLTMLALPSFGRWIANTQVRSIAESVQNGLRLAQREAASRNGTVSFLLTSDIAPTCASTASTSGSNWVVCSGGGLVHMNVGKAGGSSAVITSGFATVSFDGLGRTNLGAASSVSITSSNGACQTASVEGIRCLNVLISSGGKVRLCDPRLNAGDPSACS